MPAQRRTPTAPRPRLGPAAAGRCRRRIHLDADPTADRSRRRPPDDGTRHRWADAQLHREQTVTRLLSAWHPVVGWAPESLPVTAPEPTSGSPGPPPPAVLAPDLDGPVRAGAPDLLLWAGDGYLPVLLRGHRTTDPGVGAVLAPLADPLAVAVSTDRRPRSHPADLWALAHSYRQLTDLGLGSDLARGAVIGRGRPGRSDRPVRVRCPTATGWSGTSCPPNYWPPTTRDSQTGWRWPRRRRPANPPWPSRPRSANAGGVPGGRCARSS